MLKQLLPLAILALPIASAAAQQDAALPQFGELREFEDMVVERLGLTVDELEDMDIVGPDGEEIGDVEDILIDADNRIVAVVAEFGGWLDIGDREVILPLEHLGLQADRRKLVVSLTREQIEALPAWDD